MKDDRLDAIGIASPCHASWASMRGDDRVRFCGHCRQNVYNLSDMSRSEAEAFVKDRAGHACVTFFRRHDGTLLTRDCPVGWKKIRRRAFALCAGAVVLLLGLLAWTFLVSISSSPRRQDLLNPENQAGVFKQVWDLLFTRPVPPVRDERIMGKMCVPRELVNQPN